MLSIVVFTEAVRRKAMRPAQQTKGIRWAFRLMLKCLKAMTLKPKKLLGCKPFHTISAYNTKIAEKKTCANFISQVQHS